MGLFRHGVLGFCNGMGFFIYEWRTVLVYTPWFALGIPQETAIMHDIVSRSHEWL